MAAGWATTRLVGASVIVVLATVGTRPAQDWIPFQVAAQLAPRAAWTALYPSSSAQSLFDVSAEYRIAAATKIQVGGGPAFDPATLTAFVSPPPAALALVPLAQFSWQTSMILWRLALVIPAALSILVFAASLISAGELPVLRRWSWLAFAGAPLLHYTVAVGQPSAWLFVAATMSMLPSTRARDAVGGLALGLGVLFKATPLVVVLLLWLAGRRRLAAIAALVAAAVVIGSAGAVDAIAWRQFLNANARLATTVLADWNNAALDAALLRARTGADSGFHDPGWIIWSLSLVSRVSLVLLAASMAWKGPDARHRAVGAWIAWMAAVPILWLHYLIVLLPLFTVATRAVRDPGIVLISMLSALLVIRAGWGSGIQGDLYCLLWLASALWLLSNRDWRWRTLPS